jgi:hypothetical protein
MATSKAETVLSDLIDKEMMYLKCLQALKYVSISMSNIALLASCFLFFENVNSFRLNSLSSKN